jgi:hypothetical protein
MTRPLISQADESALSWFFGPGLTVYERSTSGAILAKLVRESAYSEACKRCDGAGILGGEGGFFLSSSCEGCGGSGKAPNGRTLCVECNGFGSAGEPRRRAAQAGGWCPDCSGTGSTSIEHQKRRHTPCHACCKPLDNTGRLQKRKVKAGCRNCYGSGMEPVNVKPMHKAQEVSGVQADHEALARFAVTSRRVARLRAQSPLLADALAAWYGDKGQLRGDGDESRADLLYPLTEDGRAYLLALEDRHTGSLQALKELADDSAAELYLSAACAWNALVTSKRDAAALARLATSLDRLGYGDLCLALRRAAA